MKDIYQVIQSALLTEKGTRLSDEENKYLFRVNPRANKAEIKKAVEECFQVKVVAVNTMNRQGKKETSTYCQRRTHRRMETCCGDTR
jgi:large subunit ribosomal protein L23